MSLNCHYKDTRSEENVGFQEQNLQPDVKHRGGSVRMWGCFAGQFTIMESSIDSTVYQREL